MKLTIDTQRQTLTVEDADAQRELPLYSKHAFELLSHQWLKVGWDQKYSYTFSWLGRPVIQLPEDMMRAQEAIYQVKPDVIVETGVARGGSLVFYASLCKAMGKGRVIGVDIEIRQANREAIESHELSDLITLIEGDSASPAIVDQVRSLIAPGEQVLVLLDSCHTKSHVASELEAYCELVTAGYRSSFFNPEFFDRHGKAVATARAGNVFGGGDWQVDRIVPDCVRHLERNEPIIVRSPHAVRPWQHVLEPLSGYLLLAQRMAEDPVQFAEAWNFGPRESSFLPVGALVDKMVNGWGSGSWEDRSSPDAPHEANLLKLDINKASSVLGWEPVWDMGTAVAMTIEWYRNYRDRSVHELCARQISAYMQASNEAGG